MFRFLVKKFIFFVLVLIAISLIIFFLGYFVSPR